MAFLDAGADIIETNTFNGTTISQSDYELDIKEEVRSQGKGEPCSSVVMHMVGRRGPPCAHQRGATLYL